MLVFHTPLSLLHDPPHEILSGCVQPYFESPERYFRILTTLLKSTAFEERTLEWPVKEVVTEEVLEAIRAVHDERYFAFLAEIYDEWVAEGGSKDAALPETFLRSDLLLEEGGIGSQKDGAIARIGEPLLLRLVGTGHCESVHSSVPLLSRLDDASGADTRPPGHHATDTLCGGYCYLNSAAISARHFQRSAKGDKPRVAILDIDYHHGNGTSKIFYDDPTVLYVSLHGSPDYPYYTGSEAERGGPNARGTNINYPLPLETDNEGYLTALEKATDNVRRFEPELMVVSLGVDTYIDDPLTNFKVTLAAYPEMGRLIAQVGVKTLFVMEGGYYLDAIGDCVRGVLEGFEEEGGRS
ncbi:putative acetylpolyamine aminohydrolase [Rhodotorula toruloides ATCC 204091]|uniref:Putative acetylpolyamine aminohydrolase n=1 Tax=Rhodotorula toruloides TaxID=5286 RepID=A0A0K3CLW0_RHOTO|nr:putative acetylpolyamine aminohydrolase [Rhodotorula toruloides ATCC 204091]PRQ70660.1 putative acetylpolyamine aminohydrolase [Rhodotorula toruloides]